MMVQRRAVTVALRSLLEVIIFESPQLWSGDAEHRPGTYEL